VALFRRISPPSKAQIKALVRTHKEFFDMRVIPKTLLIAVAAVALMGAGGDGGGDEDKNSIVYQADIQDRDNQYASVSKILVSGRDGALSASGWRGFDRRNQN
jgi:hypothetical protein